MNFSFSELLVILLIALLVIKPEQLPEVAHTVGKFARMIKSFFAKAKEEMDGFIDSVEQPNDTKRDSSK